jgi:DNA-binding transcriptional MocR family regulator
MGLKPMSQSNHWDNPVVRSREARPSWIAAIEAARGPRYQAIIRGVRAALMSGALRVGDRLPPQRELARMLRLNLGTVTRAFDELREAGLIKGEVGRGTYLTHLSGADGPPSLWDHSQSLGYTDLSHNFPDQVPTHPAIESILSELAPVKSAARLLAVQADAGHPEHRSVAARWLSGIGLRATPEDVTITTGAQHGLLLALGALTQPGDIVLTEELTFYGLKSAAAMLGRSLLGVRMDSQGLVPDYLDLACQRSRAKVLFCCPTLHNPTTATMSVARRREIVEICQRHDVTIVEDDVYALMPDELLPPLATMAPERTVYVTGLSKLFGPGLRIGFIAAPAQFSHSMGVALRATTLMASPLNADAACRILTSASLPSIVDAIRNETRERQAIVSDCLPSPTYVTHPGAFYFGLRMQGTWTAEAFARAAASIGVGVTPYTMFETMPLQTAAMVRVCHNAAPTREHLRQALSSLAELRTAPSNQRPVARVRLT